MLGSRNASCQAIAILRVTFTPGRASALRILRQRIEQSMQVNDKVPHLGVVDCVLRLRPPGRIGAGIVWIDAHNVKRVELLEFDARWIREFAAEYQMEQLLLRLLWDGIGHRASSARSSRDRHEIAMR
jgi:hypothetical protein